MYVDNGGSFSTEGEVNYLDNSAVSFSFESFIRVLGSVTMHE